MEIPYQTMIFAAFIAAITTVFAEPIKIMTKRIFDKKFLKKDKEREHDIENFKTLSNILQEGILRATLYAIKHNAEFYSNYIAAADQYILFVENYQDAKFLNVKIENAHCAFLDSLRKFEKDLFNDFIPNSLGTYIPNENLGMNQQKIIQKYSPIIDNVLQKYTLFRTLIKTEYQI